MEAASKLQRVPFFAGLSGREAAALSASMRRRRFRRGEVIFHRDDPGDCLFLINSGAVKISLRSQDDREFILTLLGAGDYFGELAILDGLPRSADAIAVEATELQVLPREAFLGFMEANAGAGVRLLAAFSRQYVRRLTDSVSDAAFLDLPARLARVLVQQLESRRQGESDSELRLTQTDLAAMVGATRESINKWLGYYERQGWVKRERGFVRILNRDALLKQS
jgi:CRP/FNR family transcriptional regulator/CRP/FNR family cyclic AMP-dependent transcriptional regulator